MEFYKGFCLYLDSLSERDLFREEVTGMTREQMDRIIEEHFGYEARDNVEGVLSTLTEDVEHDVVGSPGSQIRGRDAARGPLDGP